MKQYKQNNIVIQYCFIIKIYIWLYIINMFII